MAYRPSDIKSIQRGTISISTTNTSGTATITAVTSTASVIESLGVNSALHSNSSGEFVRIELTTSTTVTAYRASDTTGVVTVGFQVTEFFPSVLKQAVQAGIVAVGTSSGSATATITALTSTGKSALYNLGVQVSTSEDDQSCKAALALTNSTTVTATRGGTKNGLVNVGYAVVEFK